MYSDSKLVAAARMCCIWTCIRRTKCSNCAISISCRQMRGGTVPQYYNTASSLPLGAVPMIVVIVVYVCKIWI